MDMKQGRGGGISRAHRLWYKCPQYIYNAFAGVLLVIKVYLVFKEIFNKKIFYFLVHFGLIDPDSDYVVPVYSIFVQISISLSFYHMF